jgi:hypothetical protein
MSPVSFLVSASPGDGQVSLSWPLVASASSYSVYRRPASRTEDDRLLHTGGETLFTDTGLTNGSPYCYVVKAYGSGGEVASSKEVSATPQGPPAALLPTESGRGQARRAGTYGLKGENMTPDDAQCLARVIEFVEKPEVAGFYIGMTGPDLRARLLGYDHRYAGRRDGWAVADGLDENGALDLEEFLCRAVREPRYRTTAIYTKYDDKGKHYCRSAGGAKTTSPYEKVHQVYVAWRHESLPPNWRRPGNLAFLQAVRTRDDGNAEVHVARNDTEFLEALATRDNFFLLMRIKLHFHTKDCRKGRPKNAKNFTKKGTKATSISFVALYQWAQRNRPPDLADEDQWHICDCCRDLLID